MQQDMLLLHAVSEEYKDLGDDLFVSMEHLGWEARQGYSQTPTYLKHVLTLPSAYTERSPWLLAEEAHTVCTVKRVLVPRT